MSTNNKGQSVAYCSRHGSVCSGRRPASHCGPRQRARAVAPEYGGGREYDIEAEFMDELGPLPTAHGTEQMPGTAACMSMKELVSSLPN